jgi:hypothetical protein
MDSKVHERLGEMAQRKRMSLYDYTNYLLEIGVEIEESGVNLEEMKEFIKVMGKVFQFYKGTVIVAPFNATEIKGGWRELGKRLGVIVRQSNPDCREGVIGVTKSLLWPLGQVVENGYEVRALSPTLTSKNVLENLKEMMEGLLESAGVKGEVVADPGALVVRVS